jgi:AAA+ superfamily predicted ATPase
VSSDDLLASLLAALDQRPDDHTLRLHVASQFLAADRSADALRQISQVLTRAPGLPQAITLLQQATAALAGETNGGEEHGRQAQPPEHFHPAPPAPASYDWLAAERDLGVVHHPFAEPAFVRHETPDDSPTSSFDIERPALTLADVGGMIDVKARLDSAFLTPMRNPELRKAFGKSLRGGLMLYGPPGCGKTFLARALAGELGARFMSVSLSDVLDMWIGSSERNVHEVFRAARQSAPCVVFLDEIDALGHKRSQLRGSAQRGSVNQLLIELDGATTDNEGVFVLAASNAPWDVDPALRRPGRLDRTVLVLPPDESARASILRSNLSQRPVSGVDIGKLVKHTDRFSGADLAHVVETAAERALSDSVRSGKIRPITMRDLTRAITEVRPSTGAWFETARNVAEFANTNGEYDDLLTYLKARRMI